MHPAEFHLHFHFITIYAVWLSKIKFNLVFLLYSDVFRLTIYSSCIMNYIFLQKKKSEKQRLQLIKSRRLIMKGWTL